jgi:hypothetical protein
MPITGPPQIPKTNLKQMPIPVVPGARVQLTEQDGTITRSGQLMLQQLQAMPPWVSELVSAGPHADRPASTGLQDGSLYCETDRGGVLYQLRGGNWWYVAGTMYSYLSPDDRPTDLGLHDGGFDYRTTDTAAPYADREFIWSQTQWVEVTAVRYWTHAARLAVSIANVIDQMLWVETDRSVIYQLQSGNWYYLAGIMFGSLSPDQRPTDLGVHDAGFTFRSVDTTAPNVNREFMWSQTAWVETTGLNDPTTTTGDMIYHASTGTTRLGIGTSNQVLTVTGGLPTWTTPAAGVAQTPWLSNINGGGYNLTNVVNIGVGANAILGQPGDIGVSRNAAATNGAIFFGNSGAAYIFYNGTAWSFSPALPSDIRLKQNVRDLEGGLPIINQLRPIAAEWNGLGGQEAGKKLVSLIAQELQEILPGTIVPYKATLKDSDEEIELLSFEPLEIICHMILAIQQLSRQLRP